MTLEPNPLSQEQLQFLAVLAAFNEPVCIDVAGAVSPILPGKFMALLPTRKKKGWIRETANGKYILSNDLPAAVNKKIQLLNHAEAVSNLLETLHHLGMTDKISNTSLIRLYTMAGQSIPAAKVEWQLALDAAKKKDGNTAYSILHSCVSRLSNTVGTIEADKLFLLSVLDFSNMCYAMGKSTGPALSALKQSRYCAERVGDKRSLALIDLHLGRLLHVSGQHVSAISALSSGLKSVKALGDKDIKEEAAVFIGIYYYIQGRFKTAIPYFEKALNTFQHSGGTFEKNSSAAILFAYCSAYLGEYHTGIASLECNRELAQERSDFGLAATLQAILGTILVLINKQDTQKDHLEEALALGLKTENSLAIYIARGGLAYKYFSNNSMKKAYTYANEALRDGIKAGFVIQYSSPWILEMLHGFHRSGWTFPGIKLDAEFGKINEGVNRHLKGVYFRLQTNPMFGEKNFPKALSSLQLSIDLLKHSGDSLQLAKSWFEVARLKKKAGESRQARKAAQKAWDLIQPYGRSFFPNDLHDVLNTSALTQSTGKIRESFLNEALKIIEDIPLTEDQNVILSCIVRSITRLFHGERGALVEFPQSNKDNPVIRAGYFLLQNQLSKEAFKEKRKIIYQSFKTNKPLLLPLKHQNDEPGTDPNGYIVCFPIKTGKKTMGVLYHENSFYPDLLNCIDMILLKRIQRHISTCIDRYTNFGRLKWERNILASEKNLHDDTHNREDIIAQSRVMQKLLHKADQVSRSDSTVMITGETGVGKELLAKRLHKNSQRSQGPFVAVDLSSLPENLLESELFGHEKGSFTGADHQRRGRVELADKGTLFIDEIGEISKYIQVKLLRVIQEKSFSRVGGTRAIKSDFRLVVATNRNLEEEVTAGRFREDLYYRLNVIPISLPPLRQRASDISFLSNHFVDKYARRYGKTNLHLTRKDIALLNEYYWPGNIRELKNVIERSVTLSSNDYFELQLPSQKHSSFQDPFSDLPSLDDVQRRYILHVLKHTGNKQSGPGGAAEILGIKRQTLYARIKKLGINI